MIPNLGLAQRNGHIISSKQDGRAKKDVNCREISLTMNLEGRH